MSFVALLSRSCANKINTLLPYLKHVHLNSAFGIYAGKAVARQMGTHKRTMIITPSRFQWNKTKDVMHYYFLLGAIPLGTLIFLVNIFVGPAELAEIPEGYEPQPWEYYKDPIKRFFARYVYKSEQEHYEKHLHFICQEEERRQIYFIERKIHNLMKERSDYKSWYYQPITGKYHRIVKEDYDRTTEDYTGQN